MLIVLGGLFVLGGLVLKLGFKIPLLGRLPGDILIENKNIKVYFPLGTSLLLSLLISLILYIISRFK